MKQTSIALEALEMAADMVAAHKIEICSHIRISTSAAFGRDQLLPILPGLLERYPGLSVEIDFDDRIVDFVQEGYDLAIRGSRIVDSSLISRPFCQLNMILVASAAYLARYGVPQTPAELKHHKLIARRFLGGKVSLWDFKQSDSSVMTLEPDSVKVTLSASEALVQAACMDLGIAQVGVHHAYQHLKSGKLHIVLLGQHDPGHYEMVIQYPHRALIAPRVRAVIDYFLSTFDQDEALHVPLESLPLYCR